MRTASLEVTFGEWRDAAGYRLMCRLAGITEAGRGLTSPSICDRWLPWWLPSISLASLKFDAHTLDALGATADTVASGYQLGCPSLPVPAASQACGAAQQRRLI